MSDGMSGEQNYSEFGRYLHKDHVIHVNTVKLPDLEH